VRIYEPEELGRAGGAAGERAAKRSKPRADVEKVAEEEKVGIVQKLKGLNAQARARLRVSRSGIHGWGLFVKEPIAKVRVRVRVRAWVRVRVRVRVSPSPSPSPNPNLTKGEMLVEYQGTVIRASHTQVRVRVKG